MHKREAESGILGRQYRNIYCVCAKEGEEAEEEGFVNFISFVFFSVNKQHTLTHTQIVILRFFTVWWELSTFL